jgi:4-amino-4-deoxy-L-arabinose transferase-like glycosyltransferase
MLKFLLISALFLRLAWVLHLPVDESGLKVLPDQTEYLALGKNLLIHHSLAFDDPRFEQTVYAYRTPGYPLLVAICGANVAAIRIMQAVIDTSTVLAAFFLARRWLSPQRSLFAAAIVAINPFLIYFTGLILSETLFIAMLVWAMALLVHRFQMKLTLIGSLLLALATLIRPSALLLPAALAGYGYFVTQASRRHWRFPIWSALWGLMMTALVLAPWAIRNHLVLHHWIWTTTNSGITQYDGFNPRADGSSNQDFVTEMPELAKMGEVERSKYLAGLARNYVIQNPLHALELAVRKIGRTWTPIPLSSEYKSRRAYVLAAAAYSIPLDLLLVWGLLSGTLPRAAKVYLMIPALYFTLVHALSVGSLRYRIPAEVPMAIVVASCQLPVARKATGDSSLATGN